LRDDAVAQARDCLDFRKRRVGVWPRLWLEQRQQARPKVRCAQRLLQDFVDAGPLRFSQVAVPARAAARDAAPSIVHADGSARPQLVAAVADPLLHRLSESGVPFVSFGRPISLDAISYVATDNATAA